MSSSGWFVSSNMARRFSLVFGKRPLCVMRELLHFSDGRDDRVGGSQHIPVQGGRGLQILVLASEITVCLLQPSVRGTGVSGLSPHSLEFSHVALRICGQFSVSLHESLDLCSLCSAQVFESRPGG